MARTNGLTRNPRAASPVKARAAKAALAACLLSGVIAANAGAATGDLVQKQGAAGCLSLVGFCLPATALNGAASVTVSPDGRNAYVASDFSDAVAVFDRESDGTLVQKPGPAGCISDTGAGRCADGTGLLGATGVTVSPDGESAYVASRRQRRGSRVRPHPERQADPEIRRRGLHFGVRGRRLRQRDGTRRRPVSGGQSRRQARLRRRQRRRRGDGVRPRHERRLDPETRRCRLHLGQRSRPVHQRDRTRRPRRSGDQPRRGERLRRVVRRQRRGCRLRSGADGTLAQKPGPAGCISRSGAGRCGEGTGLDGAASVTVSPDGKSAYVASTFSDAVAVFDRRRNGRLVQKPGAAGCISDAAAGPCIDGTGLDRATSVRVSADGQSAYVVAPFGSEAVAVFDRAPNGTWPRSPPRPAASRSPEPARASTAARSTAPSRWRSAPTAGARTSRPSTATRSRYSTASRSRHRQGAPERAGSNTAAPIARQGAVRCGHRMTRGSDGGAAASRAP
jgi:DNA-binding beta-propeller fold protein YncE